MKIMKCIRGALLCPSKYDKKTLGSRRDNLTLSAIRGQLYCVYYICIHSQYFPVSKHKCYLSTAMQHFSTSCIFVTTSRLCRLFNINYNKPVAVVTLVQQLRLPTVIFADGALFLGDNCCFLIFRGYLYVSCVLISM